MSTLIVIAPPAHPGTATSYEYLLTANGQTVDGHASVSADQLPEKHRGDAEVVVLVPAAKLSWHQVTLPPGITGRSSRLRAVLEGLLEDRLLDEPGSMHFSLEPGARPSEPIRVAACDKAWLRSVVDALEIAGHAVTRIVPETFPDAHQMTCHVVGSPEDARLLVTTKRGAANFPLVTGGTSFIKDCEPAPNMVVYSEAGVAELAEQWLQRSVRLQQPAERYLMAIQSDWNLAQFDFANSSHGRSWQRLSKWWGSLFFSRQWRVARWGLATLIMANIAGLNAWAWQEKTALDRKRDAIRDALTQSFPKVGPIVDAPLQMSRQVALLRQSAGMVSGRDMESLLGALSAAVPSGRSVSSMEFSAGELKVKGLNLSNPELVSLTGILQSQGYSIRSDGDALVLSEKVAQ